MKKSTSGFTIVELLIVIVVIAILATISVVAYNGIQARAKFTQQVSEIDKVGKAIQLWSAENGKSLGDSGHGYDGRGVGWFYTGDSGQYPPISVYEMLSQAGYLPNFSTTGVNSTIMLAPCTVYSSSRWVVLATFDPAPPTSVEDQIDESGCTNSLISSYPNLYGRNFIKAY